MARITIEDCLDRIDNRFDLVVHATRRARQLEAGATALVPEEHDKPTVLALREIAAGEVDYELIRKVQTELDTAAAAAELARHQQELLDEVGDE